MKTLSLMAILVVGAWLLSACSQTSSSTVPEGAAASYRCAQCQETVQWRYHATKPWLKTGKTVVHDCPSCKKQWDANLTTTSTCEACGKGHLDCPVCAKHP